MSDTLGEDRNQSAYTVVHSEISFLMQDVRHTFILLQETAQIHQSFWVGVLARMTDRNSMSIYITLDPRPLSKEWINHSVWAVPQQAPESL